MILNEQRFLNSLRYLLNNAKSDVQAAITLNSSLDNEILLNTLTMIETLLNVVQVNDDPQVDLKGFVNQCCDEFDGQQPDYVFPNEHDPEEDTEDFVNDEELMESLSLSKDRMLDGIFTGEFDERGEPIMSCINIKE